jgi:hypothetical protein
VHHHHSSQGKYYPLRGGGCKCHLREKYEAKRTDGRSEGNIEERYKKKLKERRVLKIKSDETKQKKVDKDYILNIRRGAKYSYWGGGGLFSHQKTSLTPTINNLNI